MKSKIAMLVVSFLNISLAFAGETTLTNPNQSLQLVNTYLKSSTHCDPRCACCLDGCPCRK